MLLLTGAPGSVRAHDLWLEPTAGGWVLRYGHRPGGHSGAETLPLPGEHILRATALTAARDTLGVALAEARAGRWPANAPALFVLTSSGVWTRSTEGTRNLPPSQVAHPLGSWRSVESVKGVARWLPVLARPLTAEFELVPAGDPFQVAVGDKLTLIAYRGGKPAAGVTVAYAGEPRGLTDAAGRVNIRLRAPGLQHIQASLETPLTGGEADKLIETTALDFLLPEPQR
jgi:nickel transport protein